MTEIAEKSPNGIASLTRPIMLPTLPYPPIFVGSVDWDIIAEPGRFALPALEQVCETDIWIMSALVRYLTHPQVEIDPAVPVRSWGLSAAGRTRTQELAETGRLSGTGAVISSGERKAIETAGIIAAKLNVELEVREAMHENDRSATGFLEPDVFEAVAEEFFARPLISVRGWERAIDAQSRIVREVEQVLARNRSGDVLFVGHGAVGTLLFCHYSGLSIDRAHDQPAGGGHFFSFLKEGRRVLHPWRRLEEL